MAKTKVAALTLRTVKSRYKGIWGREWPENDQYLTTLWLEEQAIYPTTQRGAAAAKIYEGVLMKMRECHSFEASST